MSYHTILYLFFFLPCVLLLYQAVPKKIRWVVLLLAGYAFFWLISRKLLLYLIGTTIFTHYTGILLTWSKQKGEAECCACSLEERSAVKKKYRKRERIILICGISVLLFVLGYLKYYNFFAHNVNTLMNAAGLQTVLHTRKLLLPIGISFYTLQAVGYMADVYWGKIQAENHPGKLALFLGFFPQIMEGPISMYSQTAEALWEGKPLKGENLSAGCIRIFWGLFKKMIIADRLHLLVTAVFDHYEEYSGIVTAVAAVAYTVQLYMEFSGTMDIVTGSGKMFGIRLPENFRRPFAAQNAADFWRRWHITLGAWFKTYIFYPMSTSGLVKKWSRFGKKHAGKYFTKLGVSALCLFPVWLCNGLWHGPRWSYLFYGMYYFVILMAGIALEPLKNSIIKKYRIRESAWYWRRLRILKTWLIIFTGELFFRANGLSAGFSMFRSIFRGIQIQNIWNGTFLSFGLDMADYLAIITGCTVVAIVGLVQERGLLKDNGLQKMRLPLRWAVYYMLIFSVIIFGAYGVGYQQVDLIYAGF
ncbi:MAG: MBOAT family O-acyltransferase [Ruminococcus sp.]|jgi:alginate O-acetyltransferase complex protein AlgI